MSQFKGVETLRRGDAEGNRMVVRLDTTHGKQIYAIGVPQDIKSRTGPTWAYLFENHGLTLIDAGAAGSYSLLADGVQAAGFRVSDIQRVIITHGHQDHDGAAGQLAQSADAEIWAHDIYPHLLQFNPWDIQRNPSSPLQAEMQRVVDADRINDSSEQGRQTSDYRQRHNTYVKARKAFTVSRHVHADETHGDLTFLHAPGHSPDEICVTLDGIVFTGDHVLPEITPHPTTKARFSDHIRRRIPAHFHSEDDYYGLEIYLRSLKLITDLGETTAILPAHRLFSKNRFNLITAQRAGEILHHHAVRLSRILHRIGEEPTSLEAITRGVFARRNLISGNLYMALSEIVAHIELLQDVDDLAITDDMRLRWKGSQNYKQLIHELT